MMALSSSSLVKSSFRGAESSVVVAVVGAWPPSSEPIVSKTEPVTNANLNIALLLLKKGVGTPFI
jgi:hypothetical protein